MIAHTEIGATATPAVGAEVSFTRRPAEPRNVEQSGKPSLEANDERPMFTSTAAVLELLRQSAEAFDVLLNVFDGSGAAGRPSPSVGQVVDLYA